MSKLRDWLIALAALALGRREPRRVTRGTRIVPSRAPNERAELVATCLLLGAAGCAIAFPFFYAFDVHPLNQLLGLSLGLAFLFVAAALIVVGKRVAVTEELAEPYPPPAREREQEDVVQIVEESGDAISRKRFLVLAGGVAVGSLGVALITPAASLGPALDMDPFFRTPWRRGRRLVDEHGEPFRADAIEQKVFYTAYPEHADRELIGAPLIVVRLDPAELRLPSERQGWGPQGIVAYSKICTHAGCAISLYRVPKFAPVEPRPALVCPCHYSTFDPAAGGDVLFGPAGRPLPQLPLVVDEAGELRAGGNFSGAVGPSWWGVRNRRAKP
jgi:ubiquinol-cytochrome c reductase iron-sulfur subunit